MKKLYVVFVALIIVALTARDVAAFPNLPYQGFAQGEGVKVDLNMVGVARFDVRVGIQSAAFVATTTSPAVTNGAGDGIDVTLTWGTVPPTEEDPSQDIVNTATEKTYNPLDLGYVSASEEYTSSKRLVNASLVRSSSTSGFQTITGDTVGSNYVENLNVNGDLAGLVPIMTAASITETVDSYTTAGDELVHEAQTIVHGLAISMPFGISNIDIVTADVMTTTAVAQSNGETLSGMTSATAQFFNLRVGGTHIPSPDTGTIITVTAGALDVARVSIVPVLVATETITQSVAEAVALNVEVLSGIPSLNGTSMELGRSRAQSSAAEPGVPTAVQLQTAGVAEAPPMSPLFIIVALGGLLSLPIVRRYRTGAYRLQDLF